MWRNDAGAEGTHSQGGQGAARQHHQGGRLSHPPGGYPADGGHCR